MPARKTCVRTTSTTTISAISTRSIRKMRRSALIGTTIAFWVKPDTSDQVADRGTSSELLELDDADAAGRACAARRRGGRRRSGACAARAATAARGARGPPLRADLAAPSDL